MNSIFTHLGFNTTTGQTMKVVVINNPDGSPRWICPVSSKTALFLKFYTITGFKSALIAFMLKAIFALRLQRYLLKVETLTLSASEGLSLELDLFNEEWAIFTGTKGPNNKVLVFRKNANSASFFKVASTKQAQTLITNEHHTIKYIESLALDNFISPHVKSEGANFIELSDVSEGGERLKTLSSEHLAVFSAIYNKTSQTLHANDIERHFGFEQKLSLIEHKNDPRLPKGLLRKLRNCVEALHNNDVKVAWGHGDFTPWNCYATSTNQLAIYDLELAAQQLPIGFDVFHFIIQKGVLVDRQAWSVIKQHLASQIPQDTFETWLGEEDKLFAYYLQWYLVINTINGLMIYVNQREWHEQVEWLLQTWNDGLSDISSINVCARQLIITDLFDWLSTKEYATIKFTENAPETLSEFSDIDICLHKSDASELVKFLKRHPLVLQVCQSKQSNMNSVQVILRNGKILSLDLIWRFKRKNLVMLDLEELLKRAVSNKYGVKRMDILNQARFIGLFYGLNNGAIPEKYLDHAKYLADSRHLMDRVIYRKYCNNEVPVSRELSSHLKLNKPNKGIRGLLNTLAYYFDIAKGSICTKGMIMTFSGVDGAGKSTVIERIKFELEKKFRKRVVVIRHRPSILPILSVWQKGKARANQDVISSLPRQGNNKNPLSSAFRFAYYYTDYLIGQFYIWLRYKSRGFIVLYDRYYFDFINDSKRSNIILPKKLIKFGYNFLIKPDLNFFLYADADTILERKKELDKPTIEKLTSDYRNLFENFSSAKNRYHCIENKDLEQTIRFIMNQSVARLA